MRKRITSIYGRIKTKVSCTKTYSNMFESFFKMCWEPNGYIIFEDAFFVESLPTKMVEGSS